MGRFFVTRSRIHPKNLIPRSRNGPILYTPFRTLWSHSRLPHAYLSKTAESALAARAKIHPPCTLKHRVQQEYNSLLVNALNRIFKRNLSLNNFKWLLTKPGAQTGALVRSKYFTPFWKMPLNWIPRSKAPSTRRRL